ncbi:hypothetical protein D9M72_482990 [compost metagenome]
MPAVETDHVSDQHRENHYQGVGQAEEAGHEARPFTAGEPALGLAVRPAKGMSDGGTRRAGDRPGTHSGTQELQHERACFPQLAHRGPHTFRVDERDMPADEVAICLSPRPLVGGTGWCLPQYKPWAPASVTRATYPAFYAGVRWFMRVLLGRLTDR